MEVEWNSLKDKNNRKSVNGITRAKRHKLGIRRDVGICRKIPEDIRLELKTAFDKKKVENEIYMEGMQEDEDEDDEVQEIVRLKSEKGLHYHQWRFLLLLPRKRIQKNINDASQKDARARIIQYIAHFFYGNEIPFNVVRLNSFKLMIEAVGNHGPHLKPPSYHKLRVTLLKKRGHEEEQMKYGCSIMSDG
ncbi:hypothetical protein CR513_29186, partial [Mucuna pruriens]